MTDLSFERDVENKDSAEEIVNLQSKLKKYSGDFSIIRKGNKIYVEIRETAYQAEEKLKEEIEEL